MRKTVAAALAAAFGFVIALQWNQVVQGGLALAGVSSTAPKDVLSFIGLLVAATVITVVMVIFILLVSRLAGKEAAKEAAKE